jgi:hypothetical protein
MKAKLIFFLLCTVLESQYLCAQAGISPTIPSPNASSLGLYGEVPVSYFTGVPDISVPLYQIKGNKIGLPLTLSYHASGLKPDIHPSFVGNGWSLQAGGAITRKTNGFIDEYKKSFSGTQGYYFNYSDLNLSNWSSTANLSKVGVAYGQVLPPANPLGVSNPVGNISDVDTGPDEFDFNFLDFSGKFFLDQTGNWQVQSDKALKVVFNQSDFVNPFIQSAGPAIGLSVDAGDVCKTFGKFTLIDAQGNKYVFGSTDLNNTAIEFTDNMIAQTGMFGASITATSWFLSQIISADGTETINLNYVRGPLTSFIGYEYNAQQFNIPGDSHCQSQTANPGRGIYSGRIVFPVYLTSITMPNQSLLIDFTSMSTSNELTYSYQGATVNAYAKIYTDAQISMTPAPFDFPSPYTMITNSSLIPYFATNTPPVNNWDRFIWLKLDAIRIKNSATNAIQRNINFAYTNNPQKRLQLNSVNITDAGNLPIGTNGQNFYSFSYNQTALPNYLTIYGDHWGFNNYSGANSLLIGWNGSPFDFYTPHNPDPTGIQTQAEILTGITYPTGGSTTFTYEPNQYSSVVDRTTNSPIPIAQTGIAGGLRIKQIINTDPFNVSQVKNYFYVSGYTAGANPASLPSSGVLDSKPQYTFLTTGTTTDNRSFTNSFVASNSVIPVSSSTMGSFIGYSYVVEQNTDASYTIYKFSNHDNGYADQAPVNSFNGAILNGYNIFNSLYFERGNLLDQTDYNASGQKVSEKTTQYSLTMPGAIANAVLSANSGVCGYNNVGAYSRTAYAMNYSPFLPASVTSTAYASDGSGAAVVKNTTQTYDQYKNLLQQQTVNSKGQTEVTAYSYPPFFATSDPINPYSMMTAMNNVSAPVAKSVSISGNVVSAEIHTYKIIGANSVYNDAVYNFETTAPVLVNNVAPTAYSPGSGQISFDSKYIQVAGVNYDASGNVSSVNKAGNDATAYLWDYNQELPVAKVANANNIYASGITNNIVQTENLAIHVFLALNTNITQNLQVGSTGTVNLAFAYSNPGVSGSSQLNWSLYGPTFATGTLCAATATSTTNCGSQVATAVINNVVPGNYSLVYYLVSCLGFQNYYGYSLNVQYPVNVYAKVNAQNDIACTSFEYNSASDLNYGTGNWSGISLANIRSGPAATGNNYYLLTGTTLNKTSMSAAQTYIVSYWSDNGPYTVAGSQSTTTGATISAGNWKYYEHVVTGITTVNIAGSGDIDELRVYPKSALMTSYTYSTLAGMTSQCDANNYITYYQYDSFNRLMLIRDRDNNILKEFQYNY